MAIAVLLITAAVYLPTAGYEFVFDDHHQITEIASALNWDWAPRYFTQQLWTLHPEVPGVYYRPVFMLWLIANRQWIGLDPAWWHLSAVGAHLLCTLLVFVLARRWMDSMASGVAALLFGVHPAHVEAVTWISGASEPLWGIFGLASILCYLRWDDAKGRLRWMWLAVSLGFYAVAMLAKETACVLFLVVFTHQALFHRESKLKIAGAVTPYVAALVGYLAVRAQVIPGLMLLLKPVPLAVVAATWPSMLVFYLKQLVWPLQMSELHYFPYVTYLSLRRLILPVALLLGLGYGLLRWSRQDRAAGFFWSLMALPILPLLDFRAFGMDEVVHDRYLYIPSAGLCLLLGLAWQRLVPRVTPYHFLAVAAVAGFLGYRTIRESAFWHDDVSLFRHTYDVAPQHVMAPEDLGQVLFLRGELADALPYLERAVAMGTHNREVFFDLGRIHFQNQDWEGAAVLFEQALLGNAKIARYLFFQGVTDFHRGRLEEAEQEIREAIRARESLVTDFGMPHLALAYVLEKRGDREGALAELMAELHDHPGDAEVQQQIRRLRQ